MHSAKTKKSFFYIICTICAFLVTSNRLLATHPASSEVKGHAGNHAETGHAEEGHGSKSDEKFDAGEMIFDHVTNAHSWHLWGHTELSLPVIVYNKTNKRWDVFSSAKFEHGHVAYMGYTPHQGKLTHEGGDEFYDLSLTKNGAAVLFSSIILLLIMFAMARNYKKRGTKSPKGIASFVEPLVLFVKDEIVKPSIGKGYERFLPYMLSLFFFIFICNIFGLIPVIGVNITGSIAVTAVLAVITFVITSFNGTKDYWKHIFLPPGVPKGLWVILIPIEIIGMFTKPFVLMVRLFANITAGHIIILGFFSLIFIFAEMSAGVGWAVSALSVAFTIFMSMLELLVAFLQAYVFTLLTALYIGSARESHEHEEAH